MFGTVDRGDRMPLTTSLRLQQGAAMAKSGISLVVRMGNCAAIFGLALSYACAARTVTSTMPVESGYMVLGTEIPPAIRDFALDTLREANRKNIPLEVQAAADTEARKHSYDVGCNRYFSVHSIFLVLYTRGCRSLSETEDGDEIALFDPSGAMISQPTIPQMGYYSALVPSRRTPRE